MTLASLLLETRKAKCLSLFEVSMKSGLSVQHINLMETGRTKKPGIHWVVKLADALGISPAKVFNAVRSSS